MKSVVVSLFFVLIYFNAVSQWTQTSGPVGAKSNEIIYLDNYLFVNGYDGGIYRSSDKGLTWEPVNNGLHIDSRVHAMEVEDKILYIGTIHGIFFSDNLGDSWHELTGTELSGFSIEVSGVEIFVGSFNNVAMQYSPDRGNTWEQKSSSVTQEGIRHALKFGNTLWVGTGSQLYSSPDNGNFWNTTALDLRVSSLDSADDNLFISGNDKFGFFGLYRSGDNGASWTQILSTSETNIPGSGFLKLGNTIYVSGFSALYYSDDNGITWNSKALPQSFNFSRDSYMTSIGDELFISYGDGILYTKDRGTTWERRNINYKNHTVVSLAKTNHAIVAYSESNGVYVSKDEGNNWKWIADHDLHRPRQIYAHDNTIVVSYLLALYKSEDEGETWRKIFTLTDDIPGTHFIPPVYITGWKDSLVFCTYKGIYVSPDMGDSWKLQFRSNYDSEDFIFKSYIQGDTIIALSEKNFFYSVDFGKTWEAKPAPEGLFTTYYSITEMLFERSAIIMSTQFGLYRSADFGSTWKRIECVPERVILDMDKVAETLILSTLRGVFASKNGVDWYAVRDDLNEARALTMVIKDQTVFLGTWGRSVWKRPLADLLTPRETLAVDVEEVPKPIVRHDCSSITVENATRAFEIRWYKDGVLIPNETGTTLNTKNEGRYFVSFENSCDLKTSEEITMTNGEKPEVEIFNVVTANGDGKNDYYFLDPNLVGSQLNVYNRWGEIVYSNVSYENSWSPTEISPGQYFYNIKSKCFGSFKGVLSVLKN